MQKKAAHKIPFVLLLIFTAIGLLQTHLTGNYFYITNFGYIGITIFIATYLHSRLRKDKKQIGRYLSLILVGSYMLIYLGFIKHENMQLEGFFGYIFSGIIAGAALHYIVAKIVMPFFFGRAWCGWACWTAAILDLLPWKKSPGRISKTGNIRYIIFICTFIAVAWGHYLNGTPITTYDSFIWLAVSSIAYYLTGIIITILTKDNRAFCKYICPVTPLLKLSAFSMSKFKVDMKSCIECNQCVNACPMDIEITRYAKENKRVLSSECIYCYSCKNVCPTDSIKTTWEFDCSTKQYLRTKQ